MIANGTIAALLQKKPVLVTYSTLKDEVDPAPYIPKASRSFPIPLHASLDPAHEARRIMEMAGEEPVAALVPGRRFDVTGTRHGRGGGWYDRFLAQVPTSWVRIGFCFDDQFSKEHLVRQSWDEPMDYVVVVPRGSGDPTLYETGART